jgi:ABC-type branched-subunit amino acid transport system substrate-binding protein
VKQTLGIQAYFDRIIAQGGVNGRKLKLISLNDQYSPPVALQDTKTLIEQDHVFAIVETNGTATTEANLPIYKQFGVPVVGVGSGSPFLYKPLKPFLFNIWPQYLLEGKTMGKFAIQHKWSKIGVVYQNDNFGKPEFQGFKSSGAKAVVSIPYDPTQTDFSAAAAQLKSDGVHAVIIDAIPGPAISLMNDMAQINFYPKILLSQVAIAPSSYSAVNFKEINKSYITAFIPPLTDSANPQVAAFLSAMKKYEPSISADSVFAAWGWEAAQAAVAGLKATKGRLTRASFIAGMNTLSNLRILGGNISYSRTDHSGLKTITVLENINGHRVKPIA